MSADNQDAAGTVRETDKGPSCEHGYYFDEPRTGSLPCGCRPVVCFVCSAQMYYDGDKRHEPEFALTSSTDREGGYVHRRCVTTSDECEKRMYAVVDAAVEWRRSDEDWQDKAEILETAIDALLELRSPPDSPPPAQPELPRFACEECPHIFTAAEIAVEDKKVWGHPCHSIAGEPNARCESFRTRLPQPELPAAPAIVTRESIIRECAAVVCTYCANTQNWLPPVPDTYHGAGVGALEHLPVAGLEKDEGRGCHAWKLLALINQLPAGVAEAFIAEPDDYCQRMGDCRLCPNPNGNCLCTHHAPQEICDAKCDNCEPPCRCFHAPRHTGKHDHACQFREVEIEPAAAPAPEGAKGEARKIVSEFFPGEPLEWHSNLTDRIAAALAARRGVPTTTVDWEAEYNKMLQFFGATVKDNGDLSINMKKYHAAHLCPEHAFQPWKRADIEERCVLCLQADAAAGGQVGRDAGLEEAAKIAEDKSNISMVGGSTGDAYGTAKRIAAAIRSRLSPKGKEQDGKPETRGT